MKVALSANNLARHLNWTPEDSVTVEFLRSILWKSLIPNTSMSDGLTRVEGVRLSTVLELLPDQLIRFRSAVETSGLHKLEQLMEATNHFNMMTPVAKAFVIRRDELIPVVFFESDLSFRGGLLPRNLVTRLRAFETALLSQHTLTKFLPGFSPRSRRPEVAE